MVFQRFEVCLLPSTLCFETVGQHFLWLVVVGAIAQGSYAITVGYRPAAHLRFSPAADFPMKQNL